MLHSQALVLVKVYICNQAVTLYVPVSACQPFGCRANIANLTP